MSSANTQQPAFCLPRSSFCFPRSEAQQTRPTVQINLEDLTKSYKG